MRVKRRRSRLLTGLVVLSLLLACGVMCLRSLFSLPYREAVEREAARFGLAPSLVAGLALAESHFNAAAVSPAGAIGLMQLTPETHMWLSNRLGCEPGSLTDAENNLYFGSAYLAFLLEKFSNPEAALAAYNAGPARVQGWLADSRYSEDGSTLKQIPFEETKTHIRRVLLYRSIYRLLYGLE